MNSTPTVLEDLGKVLIPEHKLGYTGTCLVEDRASNLFPEMRVRERYICSRLRHRSQLTRKPRWGVRLYDWLTETECLPLLVVSIRGLYRDLKERSKVVHLPLSDRSRFHGSQVRVGQSVHIHLRHDLAR